MGSERDPAAMRAERRSGAGNAAAADVPAETAAAKQRDSTSGDKAPKTKTKAKPAVPVDAQMPTEAAVEEGGVSTPKEKKKTTTKTQTKSTTSSPAKPAVVAAPVTPQPGSLTAEPVLPVKAKAAKARQSLKEDWMDDLNSFLNAPDEEKPKKVSKQQVAVKASKQQAAPAPQEEEEQYEEAGEDEDMPPPTDVHGSVVLYGYEQRQQAEEDEAPPEKTKRKSKKKAAAHAKDPSEAEPEGALAMEEGPEEAPPAPNPVSKKTLKVVLRLLDSLIDEAVRTGEVNRIIQLAEEAEAEEEKFLLDGEDWQEAARRQAGAVNDSELSGLMSGVRLPNKRHTQQDDDDDLLAPRPDEDFKFLQQQQQRQQQGHMPQPAAARGPRGGDDEGITPPGMARYALRNLGIVR